MSSNEPQQDPQQQINIELPEGLAEGTYSNLVMIAHSAEEFILDFIRVMPGLPKARVKSRIIVTPQHAKRFLRALADNIDRYEQSYGLIDEQGEVDLDQFHFGGPSAEA
ncbi:MAG: DUF3467 domain-containing protein [Bacteroidota bacterium]